MEYLKYVEEQVEKFKEYSRLIKEGTNDIPPESINRALAEYTGISVMLNAEYQRTRALHANVKEEYQVWWDEKFCQVRKENNDVNLAASKWLSKEELFSETRYRYKDEYLEWTRKLNNLEGKEAFIRRLIDSWDSHGKMIIAISNNMRSEMIALGVDSRANQKVKFVRRRIQE